MLDAWNGDFKKGQKQFPDLYVETSRDGYFDSGIIVVDGKIQGTYERVSIDREFQLVYSIADQTKKKGRVVRAAAAVGGALGVCIGTGGVACAAAKEGAEAIIELELGVPLDVPELRKRSRPVRITKGNTKIYERRGGFAQANRDFDRMNPSDVRSIQTPYGPGRRGTLPTGETVIVRPGSSGTNGRPTIEIQRNGRKTDEYRY